MDASLVKQLRDKTNAGMMDCKKALMETNGDLEKSVEILRKKGISTAAKRASKEAKEGKIDSVVLNDGKLGVIVEVNSETDFVARNESFIELVKNIMDEVVNAGQNDVSENEILNKELKEKINTMVSDIVGTIGENIKFRRFIKFLTKTGKIGTYIHMGGKIGVLIDVEGASDNRDEIIKDLCMQIAAANPEYISRDEIKDEILEKEKEIIKAQIKDKPDNIIDKIVEGKMEKVYQEKCLLDQIFVKDHDKKIKEILDGLTIKSFVRYQLGE